MKFPAIYRDFIHILALWLVHFAYCLVKIISCIQVEIKGNICCVNKALLYKSFHEKRQKKIIQFFQRYYWCVSFLFANENLSNKKQKKAHFFQILHLQRHHQDTTTYFTNLYSITLCKKSIFFTSRGHIFFKTNDIDKILSTISYSTIHLCRVEIAKVLL